MKPSQTAVGYLVSRYPAISHTFILREVRGLRQLGLDVRVASVNPADRPAEKLTREERDEARCTFVLKDAGAVAALAAAARALLQAPLATLAALAYAIRLGGADIKRAAFGLFYFAEALLMADWMRRQGLRHLHVHFATPAATVGLITKRLTGCGLSLTVHGPDEFYDVPGYQMEEKIRQADFLVAISHFAKSQLMKCSSPEHWHKIEIGRLGVDTEVFAPLTPVSEAGRTEVLCVGRLTPAKGQHVLLQAARRLVGEFPTLHVRFVGDGPDMASLRATAGSLGMERHVTFEGNVNQDRIREFYRRADVFVLPSFAEGIPVVLMEAMAMGIPCISTRITGIPELIEHGVSGLLAAPSNDEELAAQICELLCDAARRRSLGMAGRERVLAQYELHRSVENLAAIYNRRIAGLAPEAVAARAAAPSLPSLTKEATTWL